MPNVVDRLGGASSSLAFKAPCRLGTTANITLSGYQTIDGTLPTASQHVDLRRILVFNQTDAAENGIYIMDTGTWERAKDFDGVNDFRQGTRVYVYGGSTKSGTYLVTSSMDPSTFDLDTDDITFAEVGTFDQTTSALGISSGGVISWNSGDVTLTHSANALAFAGASSGYSFDAQVTASVSGNAGKLVNTADSTSVQVARLEGDRASMSDDDEAYLSLMLSNDAGTQTEFGRITWTAEDVNNATGEDGAIDLSVMTAGTITKHVRLGITSLRPITNDTHALGSASVSWSDLFLASGGVINWNGGNVTLTHSSSALAVASAAATFSGSVTASSLITGSAGISVASSFTSSGNINAVSGTTLTQGGVAGKAIMLFGSTTFGIYAGSSAPAIAAGRGSIYLRDDGGSSLTRAYIQSSGSTNTWVGLLTTA